MLSVGPATVSKPRQYRLDELSCIGKRNDSTFENMAHVRTNIVKSKKTFSSACVKPKQESTTYWLGSSSIKADRQRTRGGHLWFSSSSLLLSIHVQGMAAESRARFSETAVNIVVRPSFENISVWGYID